MSIKIESEHLSLASGISHSLEADVKLCHFTTIIGRASESEISTAIEFNEARIRSYKAAHSKLIKNFESQYVENVEPVRFTVADKIAFLQTFEFVIEIKRRRQALFFSMGNCSNSITREIEIDIQEILDLYAVISSWFDFQEKADPLKKCTTVRNHPDHPGENVVLLDPDGRFLRKLDVGSTDEELANVANFADSFYTAGYERS